jgi:tetratricopeptide (TPR) repeat protein
MMKGTQANASSVRPRPAPVTEVRGSAVGGVPKVIVKSKPTTIHNGPTSATRTQRAPNTAPAANRAATPQTNNRSTNASSARISKTTTTAKTSVTPASKRALTPTTSQHSKLKEPGKSKSSETNRSNSKNESSESFHIHENPINLNATPSITSQTDSSLIQPPSMSSSVSSTFTSSNADAIQILPRQLIVQGMMYEAVQVLLDEKFLLCRMDQLGPIRTAQLYGREWPYLLKQSQGSNSSTTEEPEEQSIMDALNVSPELAMVDGEENNTSKLVVTQNVEQGPKDQPDMETILDSLRTSMDMFRQIILESMGKSSHNDTPPQDAPSCSWVEGGQVLLKLGTCLQTTQQLDQAYSFYRCSLYFLLLDLGYDEEILLQNKTEDLLDASFYTKILQYMEPKSQVQGLIGTVLTRMGDIYSQKQMLDLAWQAYRTAYEFCFQRVQYYIPSFQDSVQGLPDVSKTDPNVSSALVALALTYKRMGAVYILQDQFLDAISCYERTLELQIFVLGEMHVDVGRSLHDMGVAQRQGGYWESALKNYIKAHKILEQCLGMEHLDTGKSHQDCSLARIFTVGLSSLVLIPSLFSSDSSQYWWNL